MGTPFRGTDPRIGCAPRLRNRPYGDRWPDESRRSRSTSVGCSTLAAPLTLGPVSAHRLLSAMLVAPGEDEQPPARRSRRDWIVDCVLFLLAAAVGASALADQVGRGLDAPLLVFDVIGGAALCLALWWRRRWPFALGLASVPMQAFSSSAGVAGLIILFTVAAYRRWQLAALIAALQLAMLPVYRSVQPDDTSLPPWAHFALVTLAMTATVAWGMFVRARRQSRWERVRHA